VARMQIETALIPTCANITANILSSLFINSRKICAILSQKPIMQYFLVECRGIVI